MRTFVPSASRPGVEHEIPRYSPDGYALACTCESYTYRSLGNPAFRCRHIQQQHANRSGRRLAQARLACEKAESEETDALHALLRTPRSHPSYDARDWDWQQSQIAADAAREELADAAQDHRTERARAVRQEGAVA